MNRCRYASGLLRLVLMLACGLATAQPDVARWMASQQPPQGPEASAIVQTPDGFLWVGEPGAVARFDGAQWRDYPLTTGAEVNDLLVDPSGRLWVASGHSLLRLEGDAFKVIARFRASDTVIRRLRWIHGRLHLATTRGVYRFESPARLLPVVDEKIGTAFDVADAGSGQQLLVGGHRGLFQSRGADVQALTTATREDLITSLEPDAAGGFWLGGYTLRRLTRAGTIEPMRAPAHWVRRLALLSNGELWVGTHFDGLYIRAADGTWRQGDRRLRGETINAIFEDSERNVWVATSGSGVHRFSLVGMAEIQFEDGLPTRLLSSIAAGRDGELWLATYGRGLLHVSPQLDLKPVATPCGDALVSLAWQAPDTLWFGGEGGLCRLRGGHAELVPGPGEVQALAIASTGGLWVLDAQALWRLEDGAVRERIYRRDATTTRVVAAMQDDRHGGVWIAGNDGLVHAGQRGWQSVDGNGAAHALWQGTNGDVWMLQNDALVLRTATGQRFATPAVRGAWLLWGDASGALWQIGRDASARTSATRLRAQLTAGRPPSPPEILATAEGHGGSQPTQIGTPQATALPDGRLAFVMFGKVRIGRLAPTPRQTPMPQAQLTGVSAPNNDSAKPGQVFEAGQWPIRFSYTAASLRAPQALQFRYRLLPVDGEWSAPTSERSQSFAGLAPGKYRFEVKVVGASAGAKPAQFEFTLLPLWHETWWVHLLFGIAVLLLVAWGTAIVWRWRLRRMSEHQHELEALVAVRTQALQDANRQLAIQARTDALTGLLNRRAFLDGYAFQWQATHRAGESIAVLIIDVDLFKNYNDQHGHVAGDEALQRIAQALIGALQWPDGEVARYGGEEFVAMLPRARLDQALAVGEAMRAAVSGLAIAYRDGHAPGIVTVSIGVAASKDNDDPSAEALLIRADVALYDAKHAGRDRVLASRG